MARKEAKKTTTKTRQKTSKTDKKTKVKKTKVQKGGKKVAKKAEKVEKKEVRRYFRSIYEDEDGEIVMYGRYRGKKPKQAANKALTAITKKMLANGEEVDNKEIYFAIVEQTRNSKHKKYYYKGKKELLDEPVPVTITKTGKDGKKTKEKIVYKRRSSVMRCKDLDECPNLVRFNPKTKDLEYSDDEEEDQKGGSKSKTKKTKKATKTAKKGAKKTATKKKPAKKETKKTSSKKKETKKSTKKETKKETKKPAKKTEKKLKVAKKTSGKKKTDKKKKTKK